MPYYIDDDGRRGFFAHDDYPPYREVDTCPCCGDKKYKEDATCNTCYRALETPEAACQVAYECEDTETVEVNAFALFLLGEEGIEEAISEAILRMPDSPEIRKAIFEYTDPECLDKAAAKGLKALLKRRTA